MKESKINYFGILKDFDFDNINKNTFPELIESGIFDEIEYDNLKNKRLNYYGLELKQENERFSDLFHYKKKEYRLKKEIIIQIFILQVKNFEISYILDRTEEEIQLELQKEILEQKKIDIIEKEYRYYYSNLTNKTFYNDYEKIKECKDIDRWIKYFYVELEDLDYDNQYNFIKSFLKGQKNITRFYIPEKVGEMWKECFNFYRIKKYLETQKDKVLEIEKTPIEAKKTNALPSNKEEFAVFKDNGIDVFNCIVLNYNDEKNKAFFSYLFHFLKSRDLLRTNAKTSSKKYLDYILNNFELKMSKVINSTAYEQTEFNLKMELFQDILKKNKI